MVRGGLLGVAAVFLLAACGTSQRHQPDEAKQAPEPVPTPARGARAHARPRAAVPARPPSVLVTVLDGDTGRRVRGARVRIGARSARTDARGVAAVPLRRRAALPVTISRRGYATRIVRLWFRQRPQSTARIYQPRLQWPLYGATPARTQAQTAIRLRPPFRLVWSRGLGSLLEFPAVVSDGRAFVGNYRGHVFALDMRTGRVAWSYRPRRGKMASSPAVAGDEVVVHGMDGAVRVLDRSSGRLRWSVWIGSPIESSPVVVDGVDYFGAWNGRVYALDLRARRLRWVRSFGAKITSSPALAAGRLYVGDYAGRLLVLAQRSGRLLWSRAVDGRVYGAPAVAGGRVFVPSSTGNSLTAFSTSGSFLWRRRTGGYVYSSPAAWGGRVFFGSYDGVLYCLSARTGGTLWSVGAGGPVSGAVVLVGGVVYAGSTWGSIVGADARTGRVLLRFPHGEYVPVSGNGGTLLLHGYSRIYAVKPRSAARRAGREVAGR
ncbi:MAG TPA: PQQ-binding-like beta-propeller repeat protein [Gaiellaceae bacterium]|nr:PQQ-binding-like beta-propeller repeat protein [Gaiellaceae bacterium]